MYQTHTLTISNIVNSMPVISIISSKYDIWGKSEVKIKILLREYSPQSIINSWCDLRNVFSGYIESASICSQDEEIVELTVVTSLLYFGRTINIQQNTFKQSSLDIVLKSIYSHRLHIKSYLSSRKTLVLSPGKLQDIFPRLLSLYTASYIFIAKKNLLVIFAKLQDYYIANLNAFTNLNYNFQYDISFTKTYFNLQDNGSHLYVETNMLSITPGEFISLDNTKSIFLVLSIYIKNDINSIVLSKDLIESHHHLSTLSHSNTLTIIPNSTTNVHDLSGIAVTKMTFGASNYGGTHLRLKQKQPFLTLKQSIVDTNIYALGIIRKESLANKNNMNFKCNNNYGYISTNAICFANARNKIQFEENMIRQISQKQQHLIIATNIFYQTKSIIDTLSTYQLSCATNKLVLGNFKVSSSSISLHCKNLLLLKTRQLVDKKMVTSNTKYRLIQIASNNASLQTKHANCQCKEIIVKANNLILSSNASCIEITNGQISLDSQRITINATLISCSTTLPQLKP